MIHRDARPSLLDYVLLVSSIATMVFGIRYMLMFNLATGAFATLSGLVSTLMLAVSIALPVSEDGAE